MIDARGTGPGMPEATLPRRQRGAHLDDARVVPVTDQRRTAQRVADPAVPVEMAALRHATPGVRGSVVAGVDGLLLAHDLGDTDEPHDLAALAATMYGLGRQAGAALRHGPFRDSTVRSHRGYFTVYAISDIALLAVLGDDGLNVARLHLEARPLADRLTGLLHVRTA